MNRGSVYCCGSFYSPEEKGYLSDISSFLEENGFQTYLPHRDGIEDHLLRLHTRDKLSEETLSLARKAVFALDVHQIIEKCDYLLFTMNGRVPDEGSVFKTALAYATGKPLVLYKNDNRSIFHGNDNSMITGLSHRFAAINAVKKIPLYLRKAALASPPEKNSYSKAVPPQVKAVMDIGRKISSFLDKNPLSRATEKELIPTLEEIARLYKEAEWRSPPFPLTAQKGEKDVLKKVYCSGPLFCPAELQTMAEIADVFEGRGYRAYLPQRDGVEAFVMNMVDDVVGNAFIFKPFNRMVNKAVFALDIYQIIASCDCFILNMNGRVPDEGGVVEAAVAFAAGKPIVIYKNGLHSACLGQDSPLLLGPTMYFKTVDALADLPAKLERTALGLSLPENSTYHDHAPPQVLKAIRFGGFVQRLLDLMQPFKPKNTLLKRMKR